MGCCSPVGPFGFRDSHTPRRGQEGIAADVRVAACLGRSAEGGIDRSGRIRRLDPRWMALGVRIAP